VNDPVGIALMVALLGATGGGAHVVLGGVAEFALQMLVGGVIGVAGGYALIVLMRRLPLPNEALYPIRTLAFGALVYGAAVLLHGSGFLAVFLAGIVIGDLGAPYKREIERFASGVASLAEIVAFIVLGLTISVRDILGSDQIWVGLALAVILIVLVRPILVGLLLLPVKLARGERLFVLWSGLKGAVPILLGAFILSSDLPEARRIYGIVFLAVLVSVVVQGGLIPTFATLLHVPIRNVELEPWSLGLRFQDEPQGLHRHFVAAGSPADGTSVADLDIGESAWISMISRNGRLVQVRGNTVLRAGDEVLALADPDIALARLFSPSRDDAS
jgi:potassium/hydrogen antiporter